MASTRPSGKGKRLDEERDGEMKETTSPLRASLEQLADANLVGVFFGKRDGTILDANDEFLRMVGYSRSDLEAENLNWVRLTPPEWNATNRLALKQLNETGKVPPFEKEFSRKDGTRVPVLMGIVNVLQPEFGALCVVADQTERKQAEKDLDRLMIERFAMLDSVGDGVYGVDIEGRCTFINAAAAKMLGYEPEECRGRVMHELIHSKRADGSAYPVEECPVTDVMRRCAAVRTGDEFLWRKDGTGFAVEYASHPIILNGRLEGSVISFKDISERKRAEEKLRLSEERFRGAFADASAGMCLADIHGRFLEVNRAFCRMTGYTEAELLASDFQTITHPDDQELSVGFLRRMVHKEIPGFVTEKRYIRKGGGTTWVRCSVAAQCDAAGTVVRFVTIVEDITERVTAELNLRRSEARYQCMVENAQEGICMCDARRKINYRNARLVEMLGYPPEGTPFKCDEIHFEEDLAEAQRRFELRREGVRESYETRLRCADGSSLCVNASTSPIPDEQGAFTGSVCMFTDITARKHLEERLHQVQKMEALGQLAGGIAHDFNNLLTVILGYSAVLERKLAAADPLHKNAVEIKKAGERAAELTQKLLAFSRKQVLRPRRIALNDLIRDGESMLRRLIGEQVELDAKLDPAVGHVQADPGQMEQVILNLAINARDAMPKGGRLLIETRREVLDEQAGSARTLAPGAYALVTFTDNGRGMDAATKARIFEPFFTTKGPGAGMGLGLATVLGIVSQSGGSISVYSEVGLGTTFKIYLPLVEEMELETAVLDTPEAKSRGETILLVEDNEGIRGLAREILEERGYRVIEASSGEEALKMAESAREIDLLLTDVVLRGMNGGELARRLSATHRDMGVLCMSGYTESGVVQQGILEAGQNFISKPFQPQELVSKVRKVLAAKPSAVKVLVVDDDAQVLSFLSSLLEGEGYRVFQAADGKQALAKCREDLPDLVITDLVMPEQEGLETIHAMRRDWPQIRVIAMSGALGGAYLELARKMGADAVMRKPFESGEILNEVRRLTVR